MTKSSLSLTFLFGILLVACGGGSNGDEIYHGKDANGGWLPPASCLTEIACVDDDDCNKGQRCNDALSEPRCQTIHCGSRESLCGSDANCESNQWCDWNSCEYQDANDDPLVQQCIKRGEECGWQVDSSAVYECLTLIDYCNKPQETINCLVCDVDATAECIIDVCNS